MEPDGVAAKQVRRLAIRMLAFLLLGGAFWVALIGLVLLAATRPGSLRELTSLSTAASVLLALGGAVLIAVVVTLRVKREASTLSSDREVAPFAIVDRKRRAMLVMLAGLAILTAAVGLRWSRGQGSRSTAIHSIETSRP